ncbi:hypothetical protein [Streptomyces globisporus]|nr:hypothetical protein [Streptomyces globisporus]
MTNTRSTAVDTQGSPAAVRERAPDSHGGPPAGGRGGVRRAW